MRKGLSNLTYRDLWMTFLYSAACYTLYEIVLFAAEQIFGMICTTISWMASWHLFPHNHLHNAHDKHWPTQFQACTSSLVKISLCELCNEFAYFASTSQVILPFNMITARKNVSRFTRTFTRIGTVSANIFKHYYYVWTVISKVF